MLYLIDGYNLMHAKGLLSPKAKLAGLHHARERLLDEIARVLGPFRAASTVVVFDAARPPPSAPAKSTHRGLTVVFAVGEENADARMESLIGSHPSPRQLTVVSSDRRVIEAARRKRARAVSADAFWSGALDPPRAKRTPTQTPVNDSEREHWMREFQGLDQALAEDRTLAGAEPSLTDEEIAAMEREVWNED